MCRMCPEREMSWERVKVDELLWLYKPWSSPSALWCSFRNQWHQWHITALLSGVILWTQITVLLVTVDWLDRYCFSKLCQAGPVSTRLGHWAEEHRMGQRNTSVRRWHGAVIRLWCWEPAEIRPLISHCCRLSTDHPLCICILPTPQHQFRTRSHHKKRDAAHTCLIVYVIIV